MPEENKSMMLAIIAVIVVVVIGAAIFIIAGNNTNSNVSVTPNPAPTSGAVMNDSKTFTLTSQNGSSQDGSIILTESGSTTKVTVTLSNPVATAEPAHIHLGSCPTPGAVKYALTNVINGSSVTNINAKFSDLKALGALAVNIHKSAEDINTYVSCGNLAF
ncbi:MAG: hypothetical protein ABIM99_00045 [Candidatus Dojkabacteria bacterium]